MSLSPGSRIGVYEVISIVGRGGMGEVYRARDTRLGRDVALKMLPDAAEASDPEWRTRFEREARALASLNHPNIAAIYGLEDAGPDHRASTTAIVMELVDGESLADRLDRGPLPLDEALDVAGQIADALEAAHQRGIVHRDLKPANVKITPAGSVKVLDFGVAKFLPDPGRDEVTLSRLTAAAVLLGTPAYMAPEQAQGRSVDRRVDVWAFGVVLYEMVTGVRPFRGESLPETLAAVLTADPQWEGVPPAVQPLLRACLERDPVRRLRDIADYRFVLAPSAAAPTRSRRSPAPSVVIATAALAAVILAFFAGKSLTRDEGAPAPAAPIRLSTLLPAGVSVTRGPGYTSSVAVSPDGRTIVIAASDKDGQRLYRRSLDRLDPTPLAGTERGSSPFFSWDGKWIGFFGDGRVKRVPAAGGASIDVAAAPGFPSGASWGPDDRIVFAYGADSHLHVVPAEGGRVERLTNESPGRQPEMLPDGRTVLFEASGHIHAYDRQNGAITKLLPGTAPRYANGHVIFSRGTTLLAAPLNMKDSSTGTATPVAEGVAVELPGSGGGRHYAISRGGSLVYVPAADAYELVVVGANAVERVVGQPQPSLENPRFSPDGRYVVVASRRRDDEPADLWLHDLHAGTASRLTSDGGRAAIWSDNGTTVTYSHLGEQQGIYTTPLDSGGARRPLLALNAFHWLVGWTPDRSALLYGLMMEGKGSAIMAYSNGQSRIVVGPGSMWGGRLSRDGRWLAYYALNSGTFEVFVTPFPEGGARWLIAEGTDPSWGPDGSEIYYRSGPRLIAARVDKTAGVKVVASRVVIDPFLPPLYDDYDIHRDGRTVVLVRPVNRTQGREVTMVLGWLNEFGRADR
ncbi:MAG: protein kinase [Acidobacteria bacterium]|nr:protein kinase [Acidobacteriota bacterium]